MSLDANFNYHAPTPEKVSKHERVRRVFKNTAAIMAEDLPPSREASLVQTKLEEAMFWANAAIARENKE